MLIRLVYGIIGLAGLALLAYAWKFSFMLSIYSFYGLFLSTTFLLAVLAFLYTSITKKYPLIAVTLSIILIVPILWETWQSESTNRQFCKSLVSECAIKNGKYICPPNSIYVGTEYLCNEYL